MLRVSLIIPLQTEINFTNDQTEAGVLFLADTDIIQTTFSYRGQQAELKLERYRGHREYGTGLCLCIANDRNLPFLCYCEVR